MKTKEKYINEVNKRFSGSAKDILLKQINLFYDSSQEIKKNRYHFISTSFTAEPRINKICNSVGMWNIQEDMMLKDYIDKYSGFTISYSIGRGPGSKKVSQLVGYHKFDEVTEKINNDDNVWSYWGNQTKEVRFLPSLVSNKRQIAFILNMESEYAQELSKADVWNTEWDEETLKPFLDERYFSTFLEERKNRDAQTTDRESSIMFGLPITLVEGIFVGRKIENDKQALEYIKVKLPDCYICNLDGKVIVGNMSD